MSRGDDRVRRALGVGTGIIIGGQVSGMAQYRLPNIRFSTTITGLAPSGCAMGEAGVRASSLSRGLVGTGHRSSGLWKRTILCRRAYTTLKHRAHGVRPKSAKLKPLIELRSSGLYCPLGGFYVDPWEPVERAVITHAHADHARRGSQSYLSSPTCEPILKVRLGAEANIQPVAYGEQLRIGEVTVSLHPAGHILGSAQIKIERQGYSWVVSGDYKTDPDPTCEAFTPVRCNGFVTEATFALPIYRWAPSQDTFAEINAWWTSNAAANRASVLYGYSLGKAQRLIAGVDPSIGPIYTHGAVQRLNDVYRQAGVSLPPTTNALVAQKKNFGGALVIAPPGMNGSNWVRRFGDFSTALASGWMQVRGHRRRRAVDRGFTLSDHADWNGLLWAIRESQAEEVWVTHGSIDPLVRWLTEHGLDAKGLVTQFQGEEEATPEESPDLQVEE